MPKALRLPELSNKFYEAVDEHLIKPLEQADIDPEEMGKVEKARESFIDFVKYTFPTYKAEKFHEHVAANLDRVVSGEVKRLMLFAPPQHGKSELVSTRFPSYWLAKVPDMPIALISYGATLAERNSRNARSVYESYLYQTVYPHMMKDLKNWRMADWHVKNHRGYVLSAGVGGPITGHGFGLAVIDDPIENWAAAQSDALRESAWQWYLGTFKTRMWENGSVVLMMTRWNEDDLAGRIIDREGTVEEGGEWTVLAYPALAEEENPEKKIPPDPLGRAPGEALAPSRYSAKYLRTMQDSDPYVFAAEYQQRPTRPTGQLFKIGRVNFVDTLPPEVGILDLENGGLKAIGNGSKRVRFVRYWDFAATEADMFSPNPAYTVGTLLALFDTQVKDLTGQSIHRVYILDVVRARFEPEGVGAKVKETAYLDGKHVEIFIEREPGSAGKAVIASYRQMLIGHKVEEDSPSGDKVVRAHPVASQFNAGNILVVKAPWNREWLSELASFPAGRFKDQVDSLSGGYKVLTEKVSKWKRSKFKAATSEGTVNN